MINNNDFFSANGYPYVGNKVLLGQNENIEDLNKYLKNNGFSNIPTELAGNHFIIKTKDKKQSKVLKENLNSYLHLR